MAKSEEQKAEDAAKAKAKKEAKAEAEKSNTVEMVRKLNEGEDGPTTADVHPKEVANFMAAGWVRK